jgi:hypothetical protein
VLYNTAIDLYLKIQEVVQATGYETYNITWGQLDGSTTYKEFHVNRIMDTWRCMTGGTGFMIQLPPGPCLELVDMEVCRNFMQMLDAGVISSIDEIVMVPVDCEFVHSQLVIKGVDFVLAESLL